MFYCHAWVQDISRQTLISNLKVYLNSLTDLDLELEAVIAMSPTHHHHPLTHHNILVVKKGQNQGEEPKISSKATCLVNSRKYS